MYDDDTDDDEDDEDDDDDEDDEDDEDEDENEDDDPLPAGNLLSGGTRGDRTWACREGVGEREGGRSTSKVSGFPTVLVPAYSWLKQEQLQLAELVFVKNVLALRPAILYEKLARKLNFNKTNCATAAQQRTNTTRTAVQQQPRNSEAAG